MIDGAPSQVHTPGMSNPALSAFSTFGSLFSARFFFATALVVSVVTGCMNTSLTSHSDDSVTLVSKEITLESYRDLKVLIELPPGNRNPEISWDTLYAKMPGLPKRFVTQADGTVIEKESTSTKEKFEKWADDPIGLEAEIERRFTREFRKILRDKALKADLIAAGAAHEIDPVLILACILGEHTFNVSLADDIQNLVVWAPKWAAKWAFKFSSNDVDLADLLKRPEFETTCSVPLRAGGTHAAYWDCVGQVWRKSFMGKFTDETKKRRFPASDLKWVFFNPTGSGYTYGLGQLDPIRALMVTDVVHRQSGFRLLTVERPEEIYQDIINQRTGVHYIAANVRLMIDTYKNRAAFDISKNPGVVASLYNMGGEGGRASALYKRNLISLKAGRLTTPIENYYGFYINEKESLIRQAFDRWKM